MAAVTADDRSQSTAMCQCIDDIDNNVIDIRGCVDNDDDK